MTSTGSAASAGRLLIRADADAARGLGHLVRCLALGQTWTGSGGAVTLVTAGPTHGVEADLHRLQADVVRLHVPSGSAADAAATRAVASERGAEWIAVDGEQFDRNHLSAVAPSSARILLLDDFGRPDGTPADLVLNQNPGSSADRYPGVAPDRLLLGTDHILLRPSFLRWQHWTRPPTEGRSVLVFLGGRDPDGSTPRVVAALAGLGGPWRFEVVVGPAASEAVTAPDERFRLHRTVGDMADLMAGCDQGVVAAGGTMWELLFMQVATVSFARNEVQRRVVGDLAAKGAVVALGGPATAPIGDVVAAVEALAASPSRRRALGEAGRRVVDGDGAQRVVDAMRTASDG